MDKITILRHTTSVLAKTWKADGSIEPYGGGKFFLHREAELSGVQDLAALLTKLNDDRRACVIRGVYVGDEDAARLDPEYQAGRVRRIADLYDDVPHHWMLVEIDDFEPLCYDPVAEPDSAIDEYVQACLPSCFTGVSYFWQLSNSAGSEKNRGKLKAHVWFWLATAYTSEQLKAWATQFNVPLDRSVFNVVQVHYTSAPIFDEGVADPVPVRYGFAPGVLADEVALDLDATILAIPPTKRATRHSHMAGVVESDPVAVRLNELGMVKSVGKTGELRIECPRKEHHTGESSETSTLYYPAHTNGYANGAFKCMHDHCRDVPQREFLKALGFDTAQDIFEGLAVPAGAGAPDRHGVSIPEAKHLTTDQANAARIIKRYGARLVVAADRWFAWVGTHWAQDDAAVYRFAMRLSAIINDEADEIEARPADSDEAKERNEKIAAAVRGWAKKSEMKGTIDAALSLAKRMLTIPPEDLDANPWLLNCANGTVDLRTGAISQHSPDDYLTHCIGLNYNPEARSDVFESVVAKVACEEGEPNKPLTEFLRRWFGYCATGSVREQKFAVHWGNGRNGKSTIIDTVSGVLNGYAATAAPGLLMSGGKDRHPTEIADLSGRRMITAHETGDGGALREDFVKQATGGDKIKARYMRGDFFEFFPTHKLQLLTNYKPVIKGQDEGIWRRVLLIPYRAKFGTQEEINEGKATALRDTSVIEQLEQEKEGVLAWVVAGAVEWYRDGLNPPDVVLAATRDYQTDQDRVLQFTREECELGSEFSDRLAGAFNSGLYAKYQVWCRESGINALSKNRFINELERCVPHFRKTTGKEDAGDGKRKDIVRIYGLRLLDQSTFG